MTSPTSPTTTTAFYVQAVLAFAIALGSVVVAIYNLPVDIWVRSFLGLSTIFLVTSSFTLAKVVRDRQDEEAVVKRVDQARVDRLLAEHDPFQETA